MLDLHNVTKSLGGKPILKGINLNVGQGEILCLLGPSGCGKTTLLRVIAGLEHPDSGDVRLNNASVLHVPVHERGFGLMFQDFALFPHKNVADNILFGLKMKRLSQSQQRQRLQQVLELVGLKGFELNDVARLSGGERQRVALARSLAPNPHLLMLDEPLGSLDTGLREHLVIELRTIIKQVGLTAVYVTHDQHEAFAIADRIAIMNMGRIEQIDNPKNLYQYPATIFAARFLGLKNIVPILAYHENQVTTELGTFKVNTFGEALLLHPDGLTLVDDGHIDGARGWVSQCVFAGDVYRVRVTFGTLSLEFSLPAQSESIPKVQDTVTVRVAPDRVIPLHAVQ
jgi:ABC-type Fe3+/spermidine/putrescine transport system ATPase subunit